MKYIPIEEIWKKFPNKYLALNLTAQEVRRILSGIQKGEIQIPENPYIYALKRIVSGEVKIQEEPPPKKGK